MASSPALCTFAILLPTRALVGAEEGNADYCPPTYSHYEVNFRVISLNITGLRHFSLK